MTPRIVCVDDSDAARYVIARYLRRAGFEVEEGTTAADALRLVRATAPDLLVLDLNLPDGNGQEVVRTLRSDRRFTRLPILMVSASAILTSDRVAGLTSGADAYVTEPVEEQEFTAVVHSLLRMRRAEEKVVALNEELSRKVRLLEAIFDTVPVGLAVADDPEGRHVRVNRALAALLGVTAAPAEDDPEGNAAIGIPLPSGMLPWPARIDSDPPVRSGEQELVRPDGTCAHLLGNATTLRDETGAVSGVVGAFVDITKRKQQEDREKFLSQAALLLGESLDLETTLTRMAEVAVAHVADWCLIDLVTPEGDLRRVAAVHRDPSRQAAIRTIREYHPDARRSAVLFEVLESRGPRLIGSLAPGTQEVMREDHVLAEAFRVLGYRSALLVPLVVRGRCLGVITFVSERREYDDDDLSTATEVGSRCALALDNAMLYRAAEEASRAKDDFLATVSHELRTPLTAITGWADILLAHRAEAETLELGLQQIAGSARAQARLVDDLLDIARLAKGQLRLDVAAVRLDSLVEEVVEMIRPAAELKHIALALDKGHPVVVSADPLRMRQIVGNLLSNAVKFTPERGRVDVRLETGADQVTVHVSDNGEGIPEEILGRMFDRFVQADPGRGPGLGLGLAIVKNLAELHGGTVSAVSDGRGKGSRFSVSMPRIDLDAPAGPVPPPPPG